MKYDFDQIIDRKHAEGSYSSKWADNGVGAFNAFGDQPYPEDRLPLFLADMDFKTAPPVITAMQKVLDHGLMGYSRAPKEYGPAVAGWFDRRFGWKVDPANIRIHRGAHNAIKDILPHISAPGDGVIVLQPTYFFRSDVVACGRLSRAEDPQYASLPFNARRGGFVMGDGAAVLILEELAHALGRGARIYGEIVGYGNTCDAHHATAPRPDGTTQAECIRLALQEAGYDPRRDSLYINAHGTGTHLNDLAETQAYKLALGEDAYKAHISSIKSMTGHMFGAAGAAEAIATLLALRDGVVPPTIHLDAPDPECDLDYTPNTAVHCELTLGISDSLGFGGHNACLAFRKYPEN